MNRLNAVARGCALSLALLAGIACGGDGASTQAGAGRVASVEVSQATVTLGVGSTVALQALVRDAQGRPITDRPVSWTSGDATIATVSAAGVVTGFRIGTVQIAATVDGRSAVTTLTVAPRAVASVQVTPSDPRLLVGASLKLSARTLDETGEALSGRRVEWSSSDARVAAVDSTGLVVGISPGIATITAASESRSVAIGVSVSLVPVSRIDVTPIADTIVVGQTTQFTAVLRDSAGGSLGERMVSWGTSSVGTATVSSAGLVTGVAPGTATITAASSGRTTDVRIVVRPRPVASVIVSPGSASLIVGQTVQLTTQVTDDNGNLLSGRAVQFVSASPSVASVSVAGVITGVGVGGTSITVTSEGHTTTVNVQVSPVPVASIRIDPATADVTVGATVQLNATTLDAVGGTLAGRRVNWTSGAPTVATVSAAGVVSAVSPGTVIVLASLEGRTATSTITVRAIPVTTVTVSPGSASVIIGDFLDLTAAARDASGADVTGRAVFWTSSDERIAVVSSTGRVRAIAAGLADITASIDGVSSVARLEIIREPVLSVTVTPATLSLVPGASSSIAATPRGRNDAPLVGRIVTYASGDPAVATVSAEGLVTGARVGETTISATSEGKVGTVTVRVTPAPVATVGLTLAASTVNTGATTQATVTLRDGFGNVLTGRDVTFATSNAAVATVTPSGVVTGVAPGTVSITATSEGRVGSATLTVVAPPPAPVATIAVTLGSSSLVVGGATQATAVARDANGAVLTGRSVTWTSSNSQVATVSASGAVSAVGVGTASVTATSEGRSGSATITVTAAPPAPVATIAVTLGASSLVVSGATQATAVARDANGAVLTGRSVTWTSSNSQVATVSASGAVSAVGVGTASVTATSEGRSGSATITVTAAPPAPVATVSITLGSSSLLVGASTQATVILRDAASNTLTGRTVTYASSDPAVAQVSSSGSITALQPGTTSITATSEGRSASATLMVSAPPPAPVATVTTTLGASSLTVGATTQATAVLRDANGNTLTGRTVAWTTSNAAVATVNSTGVVTAAGVGNASITATSEGRSGSASIAVTAPPPAPVADVSVTLGAASIVVGSTTTATAVTRSANGTVLTARAVTWSSSNSGVATVSVSGVVTAVAAGSVTITATSEGQSGSASLTVTAPPPTPVATVTVSLAASTVNVGSTTQATATTRDAGGAVLTGRTVTWSSSNTGVATVSSSGVVTAVGAGSATITATSEGRSGSASVTVQLVPVARVEVTPSSATIDEDAGANQTVQLTATAYDAQNNVLTGRAVSWSSSNTSRATVSSTGLVTGRENGGVTITATIGGRSGTASITVTN